MENNKDIYDFGMCKVCKQYRPLKNGVCPECEEKIKLPKFFEDIFKRDK